MSVISSTSPAPAAALPSLSPSPSLSIAPNLRCSESSLRTSPSHVSHALCAPSGCECLVRRSLALTYTHMCCISEDHLHTWGERPDTGCHRRLRMRTVHSSPQRTPRGSFRAALPGFACLLHKFTLHQLARSTVVSTECAIYPGSWCLCLQWLSLATTKHSPTFLQFCRPCRAHSLRLLRWLQP